MSSSTTIEMVCGTKKQNFRANSGNSLPQRELIEEAAGNKAGEERDEREGEREREREEKMQIVGLKLTAKELKRSQRI